jgi:hypothetical protein
MENSISINKNELKTIMKETFIEVLTERKDLLEDAFLEIIEDIGMANAIEEGRTGKFVPEQEIFDILNEKHETTI